MKRYFAITLVLLFSLGMNAQTRGIKIGYIDMEYILQNVPDYAEAQSQLEQKAEKWKQEIEAKKVEIAKLKDALKTEKALLTKELISEREEEIQFQEDELIKFQQKKFGPNGDLMTQKAVLVKPIQDQVFTAVQDIAELKKYDFVFDKSSDLTILFAAKRHNISDQVIRAITRAEKREQMSKKQIKEQEAKEYEENLEDENPALAARRKVLEERKLAREKLLEERKLMMEQKKKEQEEKKKAIQEEKEAKKAGTVPAAEQKDTSKPTDAKPETEKTNETGKSSSAADKKAEQQAANEAKAEARAKLVEEKRKMLEERKQKLLEEREAAKKEREEKLNEEKSKQENPK